LVGTGVTDCPRSNPASSRSSSLSRSGGVFKCVEGPSQVHTVRKDLQPDEQTEEPAEKHEETMGKRRRYNRPSKSKRGQFRTYVDALKEQLELDPLGFNCRGVDHPANLIHDEKAIRKVESIIERHRARFLTRQPNEPWGDFHSCVIISL